MSQNLTPISTQHVPHVLLDQLRAHGNLKNDAALSRALEVAPPVISKIRRRSLPIGAAMKIRIHKAFALSIADIEELMKLTDPEDMPA